MDTPLTKWYCDVCDQPIEGVENGYVIWKTAEDLKAHSFKIIHKTMCDLNDDHHASAALEDFLGEEGFAYLLAKLSIGPIKQRIGEGSCCGVGDLDEFVDFMRRVQTRFYEEARRLFANHDLLADHSDDDEVSPYVPDHLQTIISKYGNGGSIR